VVEVLVIPAIDLKNGKVVRLYQGKKEQVVLTAEETSPLAVAQNFLAAGARRLHIVDLDGAFSGCPKHWKEVQEIKQETSLPVEFGGGLRNRQVVQEVLDSGIDFCILTTLVLENYSDFLYLLKNYPGRIIVSVDVSGQKLVSRGWEKRSDISWKDFLKQLKDVGVGQIIVTDVERDGTDTGLNKSLVAEAEKIVEKGLIVAGGINSIEDIIWLKKTGASGVILGRAIYERKIALPEAIEVAEDAG